ncbi:MAG TPA: TraR/DksA C4-type zinc finger protein [Edaphocola sp.]|nr:TraR/DksA C4-type zinc finger protein [Edaphocola sp.]
MATKKTITTKKTASAEKKVAEKKDSATPKKTEAPKKETDKKVVTAKKSIETKNTEPSKKATTSKKAATSKKEVAPKKVVEATKVEAPKKATPAKKATAVKKEVAPKKDVAAKKAEAPKKVAPVKKAVVKKAEVAPTKTVAKKAVAPKKDVVASEKPTAIKKKSVLSRKTAKASKVEEKPKQIIAIHNTKKVAEIEPEVEEEEVFDPQPRSILDMPEAPVTTTYRYSDDELQEFKEIIQKRVEAARDNLSYYQNLISRKDGDGDDADNRLNSMEDGSGAMEKEQLSLLAARQAQFINNLEKALVRIENKTYGICRETGKLIDKARLRAVPHATLSIEAKNSMKK